MLQISHLYKNYGKFQAVRDLNLHVPKGDLFGFVGPNGAGKSTTLKMITGILKPTSGSIEFDGHAWRRKDLNDIGTLIETPPLYVNLTAFENLKVSFSAYRINAAMKRLILSALRIPERNGQDNFLLA